MKYLFLLLIVAGSACTVKKELSNDALYTQALGKAAHPDSSKIDTRLIAITKDNKDLYWRENFRKDDYVLVVSWKGNADRYKNNPKTGTYNTEDNLIWVTTVPEIINRFKHEKNFSDLRIQQLLGLPLQYTYNYFVQFWVKQSDLFRPCPDKEINDNKCDLCFPINVDVGYKRWVDSNRINSYYNCEGSQFPWTQLGYTYDWNAKNKSHIGLSEFVIKRGANVIIDTVYKTTDYFTSWHAPR